MLKTQPKFYSFLNYIILMQEKSIVFISSHMFYVENEKTNIKMRKRKDGPV